MTEQQFSALFGVLCQIRDALVALPEEEPADECAHPSEMRVDMGWQNGVPHWICKACRFDNQKPLES